MRVFLASCAAIALSAAPAAMAQSAEPDAGAERQTVLGIGGLFVRADDPAALSAWYEKHLGINPVPTSYEDTPWMQEAGPTIIGPVPQDAAGMIPAGKSWLLNLRVADIEAFTKQLKAEGVTVDLDPQTYPNGRFATLSDPEGNPIQLWQPAIP